MLVVMPVVAVAMFVNDLNRSIAVDDDVRQALRSSAANTPSTTADSAFYTLLLGSDRRSDGENGRSDSLILVRIDPDARRVDLVSIPRDMQVRIDKIAGVQKINAAYSFGGAALAITTVSEFAGVPISHYAEVDFSQLTGLVDKLGGITVDVPESFSGGNGGVSLKSGRQTLNGTQALGFARERYKVQGGDFSRAQAQRIVLTALIEKIAQQPVTALPGLIREFAGGIATDMSVQTITQYAMTMRKGAITVDTAGCPSYAFNQDGVSYVGVEYREWQDVMRRVDAGLGPHGTGSIPARQKRNTKLGAAANAASPKDYETLKNQSLNSDSVIGDQ